MPSGIELVRWAPRVPRSKVRRLYELDARGIIDPDLIDEVGWGLHARCASILRVHAAGRGRVTCHGCEREGRHAIVPPAQGVDGALTCPACGWSCTWRDYARTWKRRQLSSGGALPAFEEFVERFPRLRDPREKMLLIDRLIHAFHYSLREQPDFPCRAVAVNLIDGKLTEVVAFLDDLAYGDHTTPGVHETRERWRAELAQCAPHD